MSTRLENTSTIAATPYSAGVSSRARMTTTTIRDSWRKTCETTFQARPLAILALIESTPPDTAARGVLGAERFPPPPTST